MNKALVTILIIVFILALGANWYLFLYKPTIGQPVVPNPNATTTLSTNDYSDLIKVENVKPNQVIKSPFTITGQARGNWFFEASFPIRLVDLSGNEIAHTIATAEGEWMTTEFIPFSAVLNFEITTSSMPAILILKNDNPSGLPENDKQIQIPVVLLEPNLSQRSIDIYYYNPELDKDISGNVLCSRQGLVRVEREIPITQTPIQDAINLLLKGQLTKQEKAQGITTEYPLSGITLEAASLNNGVLTLTLKDPSNQTSGGSCRVSILWFQIEATAKQFFEVKELKEVKFMPEELFQP